MKEDKQKEVKPMRSPIEWFFKLGDYVTKGDPLRQQDFTYYMIFILFSAFAMMFVSNLIRVIKGDWYSLIWTLVGFAIMSLQYFSLKGLYQMRQLRKKPKVEPKVESINEMLKLFKEDKMLKGGK